ncbi:hypothetical protein PUR57_32130 [Streptomyces sp. JV176]|nr:hypothetical protein [Streptomyces sp. JV176]MEE1803262.1 hypothetical protein [Streptomyces sp. JV176]
MTAVSAAHANANATAVTTATAITTVITHHSTTDTPVPTADRGVQ